MGTVYQVKTLETNDGVCYNDCTVVIENSYVAINNKSEVGVVNRLDFIIPLSQVKYIALK
jgi:hypothetical protein